MKRIRRERVVPSFATSTSNVSPSPTSSDLGLPDLAARAGHADDARAALRLRRGRREREGAAEQQQEREQAAHDQTRTPLVAAKLRRRQRRARRRNPRCTSRSVRTTRRGMRRRRLRFHPGARSTTRPSRVTASIRCSDPRARSTRLWARKPATMTIARTSHVPGGSGAPPAPVAAVTRPVAVSTARTPSRPSTSSVVTSAGARYSSWLVALLEQQLQRAAAGQRVRRVGALPQEPVAVAREAQPVELGAQAHLGDRSRLHAGRADLRAQRGLGVGERLEGVEVARAQQPRARAQVEREERVDALGEARDGDLVHRLVEPAPDRQVRVRVDLLDAVEHLAAVPARVQPVAERPGLGVRVDRRRAPRP